MRPNGALCIWTKKNSLWLPQIGKPTLASKEMDDSINLIVEPTLTFYTKPNCPLCDHALEEIELARATISFELVAVNILEDPALYDRYKHAIPVLVADGVEIFRFRVTSEELIKKIALIKNLS